MLIGISILPFIPTWAQDVEDLTRKDISLGLPQDTDSFASLEVFDSDDNGRYEIYMGGSSFDNDPDPGEDNYAKTEGIRAYEYDPEDERWEPFGSGLPGEGSGIAFAAIGLGDINGDGEMDIAAPVPTMWYNEIDDQYRGIFIYSGDGSGNFNEIHNIDLSQPMGQENQDSSNQVEIIDLDGDGHNDIVASTYTGIRIFYGDSTGTTWEEESPPYPPQTEISGVGAGDLNNDGLLDLVGTPGAPYQRSSEIVLYVQESPRVFKLRDFKDTLAGFGVKIADLNNDGNNDVVYGTANEGIKVWLGEGRMTLTSFPCSEASSGLPDDNGFWSQIELGDVNGDGMLDIISACNTLSTVNVFINDLPGGWTEVFTGSNELEVGGEPYGANFGDWDGDGVLDLAGCGWNNGANAWLVSMEGYGIPIADAGEDRTMDLGETLKLDGSDSLDRDGDIVEWSWVCTTDTSVTLVDPGTSRPGFTPKEEGVYKFRLKVKDDNDQWSNPDTVTITVLDPSINYPPVAVPYHETGFGLVGQTVHLDGSGSYDHDGEIAAYSWVCHSHDGLIITDDDEVDPNFVPAEEADYVISLVVTDDDGARSPPVSITIHVEAEKVTVILGPFEYDNGDPIKGAEVWLGIEGNLLNKETNSEGYADFQEGILPGEYVCFVTKDGSVIIEEFEISISYSGTVMVDGGEYPAASIDDPRAGSIIVILIIILAAIVVLGVLTVSVVRWKRSGPVEDVPIERPGN
ncbi:MAG: FG-GAP-like repeat-containing protein [Thermoplasmatota archaeon]